ncbi:MAG TPA: hypothetical protein EYN03_09470 [Planctomycetes bacterium]|nr:hypothetical protein [Planctomycetota bacterium]
MSRKTLPILLRAGEFDHPPRNQRTCELLKALGLKALGIEKGIVLVKDGKHVCLNREPWFRPMVNDMDRFFRRILKQTGLLVGTGWCRLNHLQPL